MANLRVLVQTFLEGLSPLDALVERQVRPGSGENLIDVNYRPLRVYTPSGGILLPCDFDGQTHREVGERLSAHSRDRATERRGV
jgi:hypothetical protein